MSTAEFRLCRSVFQCSGQRGRLQFCFVFFLPPMKTVSPNLASKRDRFLPKPFVPGEPRVLLILIETANMRGSQDSAVIQATKLMMCLKT